MQQRKVPGWIGWALVLGFAGAWDLSKNTETLSRAAAPSGTHGRKIFLLGWLYLTLHLTRAIQPIDPLWSWERRHKHDS